MCVYRCPILWSKGNYVYLIYLWTATLLQRIRLLNTIHENTECIILSLWRSLYLERKLLLLTLSHISSDRNKQNVGFWLHRTKKSKKRKERKSQKPEELHRTFGNKSLQSSKQMKTCVDEMILALLIGDTVFSLKSREMSQICVYLP